MANEIRVVALDQRFKRLERDLRRVTLKIFQFLKQERVAIDVYLIGNARMKKLNDQYRGRNKSTNVLSFKPPANFPQIASPYRFLGEVYLCPPAIKERREDINLVLAHGLLHLLGFKHDKESDRITMEKMEEALAAFIRERSKQV